MCLAVSVVFHYFAILVCPIDVCMGRIIQGIGIPAGTKDPSPIMQVCPITVSMLLGRVGRSVNV